MTAEHSPRTGSADATPLDRRGTSRGPDRTFLTADGESWRVSERHELIGAEMVHSLVFESEHAVRRVRVFPEDWMTLSDAALLALSWQR